MEKAWEGDWWIGGLFDDLLDMMAWAIWSPELSEESEMKWKGERNLLGKLGERSFAFGRPLEQTTIYDEDMQ